MKVKIIIEGELDDTLVSEGRDSVYMNLLTHRIKSSATVQGANLFQLKGIYWEREAVNGRSVSPIGEIVCSD